MLAAVEDPHATSQLHTVEYATLLGDESYSMLDKSILQKASSDELAEELGIKEAACRKRLERIRMRMRTLLVGRAREGRG